MRSEPDLVGRREYVLLGMSPEFQFEFIYEYASPALKVALRSYPLMTGTSWNAETYCAYGRLSGISALTFTRKDIRMNYF
jgi:hypothetical protein